jgi:hypothetical protein
MQYLLTANVTNFTYERGRTAYTSLQDDRERTSGEYDESIANRSQVPSALRNAMNALFVFVHV